MLIFYYQVTTYTSRVCLMISDTFTHNSCCVPLLWYNKVDKSYLFINLFTYIQSQLCASSYPSTLGFQNRNSVLMAEIGMVTNCRRKNIFIEHFFLSEVGYNYNHQGPWCCGSEKFCCIFVEPFSNFVFILIYFNWDNEILILN